jgi:hypothetical protein
MSRIWSGLVAILMFGHVGLVFGETPRSEASGDDAAMASKDAPARLESVFVQEVDTAHEVKGKLLRIGPDTLTVLANGQTRDIALARVRRIQVVEHSVTKGAWIGGLVGGVWCAWVCGQGLDHSTGWLAVVAANAGFGAAIGAGVEAAMPKRVTIYQGAVPPVMARRHGAWLTWRF